MSVQGMRSAAGLAVGVTPRQISARLLSESSVPPWVAGVRRGIEVVLAAMSCVAPWAYGAREAWAILWLAVGVFVLAALWAVTAFWRAKVGDDPGVPFFEAPSLAIAGLAALALFQLVEWPAAVFARLDPPLAALRAELLPGTPEVIAGGGPAVRLPARTLSQDPDATRQVLAALAGLWVVYQAVRSLGRGPGPLRRFGMALAANATLIALFSVVQYLSWNGRIYWTRPSPWQSAGPFFNHNHLAAYLNLGAGLMLGFLLTPAAARPSRGGKVLPVLAAYGLAVCVTGVVASLSRTGFLALAAMAVFAVASLRPKGARAGIAGLTGLVILPVFLTALAGSVAYSDRLRTIFSGSAYSPRTTLWADVLRSVPSHPVFGAGLGAFSAAAPRFLRHDNGDVYHHAESEYVEWLVDGGLVAAACGLLLAFALFESGRKAWSADSCDHGPGRGGVMALLGLVVHSAGDFALHTAAVAVPAVILAAFVSRAGASTSAPAAGRRRPVRVRLAWAAVGSVLLLGLSGWLLIHADRLEKAEGFMTQAGVNLYSRYERIGAAALGASDELAPPPDAATLRGLIARALEQRPDWPEANLRLGEACLRAYSEETDRAIELDVADPAARARYASADWLHLRWHARPEADREPPDGLAADPIVASTLVPALRAFLEARRTDAWNPLPHASIASLDFLLRSGDPATTYLARAARVSGVRKPTLATIGALAVAEGDLPLAAECWRRRLVADPSDLEAAAEDALAILAPTLILEHAVPEGPPALAVAQWRYADPVGAGVRDRFFREVVRRLESDAVTPASDRLACEANVWNLLGDSEKARERMSQALGREPGNLAWRRSLINWLLASGRTVEAHRQALVATALDPESDQARALLGRTAGALARESGSRP